MKKKYVPQPFVNYGSGKSEITSIIKDIDINVKKIIELFRFILKYKIIIRGRGIEFAGLREYTTDDDASMIDWNSTARTGKTYVKIFEHERDLDVVILLDTSSTMIFGSQKYLKTEYASIIAGTLAYSAIEVGDRAGLLMFNDSARTFIPPKRGTLQYYKMLKSITDKRNYGGKSNLSAALEYILGALKHRSIIFIISDFIDPIGPWEEKLKLVGYKFDKLVGIMVRDVRDESLPQGVGRMRISDPVTGKKIIVNIDKYRDVFSREVKVHNSMLERAFMVSRGGLVKSMTNEPFVKPLVGYFSRMM